MKVKAKCARALIRYLKAKENERENSNELCKTKLYNAIADSVSVAKIKMIMPPGSAHTQSQAHSYDAAVHLTGDQ